MGSYYNPAKAVATVGRKIEGATYQELIKQLLPSEGLYGLYQWVPNGFYHAPLLDSTTEFNRFRVESDMSYMMSDGRVEVVGGDKQRFCHGYYAVTLP